MNSLTWLMLFVLGLLGFCAWRIRAQGLTWTTAKRWLLYIPMGLLIIGFFMAFFFYADYKHVSDELTLKWMNILVTAALVFGFTLKKFWQCRRRRAFWVELTVLISAHFILLERLHWEKFSYFWLPLVIGMPEMFVIFVLLGRTLHYMPPPDKARQ